MLDLSGGELGGESFDATAYAIGDSFSVGTVTYRKVSETQAVFVSPE